MTQWRQNLYRKRTFVGGTFSLIRNVRGTLTLFRNKTLFQTFFFSFFLVALIPELEGREMEFTLNLGFVLEM